MTTIHAIRYHDISCGHRVVGHEGKCVHLHGHNYRIHFHVHAQTLDDKGRVVDFGVIKSSLCMWLEDHWDHKMLIWKDDPWYADLARRDPKGVQVVPFNPTAENMAAWLLTELAPKLFGQLGIGYLTVTRVVVEETRKCFAEARL